jgi:AcrR family transcriptional regulator
VGVGSSPGASSGDRSSLTERRSHAVRERIVDAALELFARQGYDATTVDQVAAKAGITAADFAGYFETTEAVLMSIASGVSEATAAALKEIPNGVDPEQALLSAGTAAIGAIAEGRGPMTMDRLVAMARIVTTTRNLQRKVSVIRKRVMTQPLADWMGVEPQDRRLQHALTMWSAVAASSYVAVLAAPDSYQPEGDEYLRQRMIANLSRSFGDVMGEDPQQPG